MKMKISQFVVLLTLVASIVVGLTAGCGSGEDVAAKKEAAKSAPTGSEKGTVQPQGATGAAQ